VANVGFCLKILNDVPLVNTFSWPKYGELVKNTNEVRLQSMTEDVLMTLR